MIDRKNGEGVVIQSIKIPLSYAPRNKVIARIEGQPNDPEQDFQVVLPRMSFEMTGMTYDPTRRISLIQQNRGINNTSTTLNSQYAPTPYNIGVNLYIYTKNQEDGLQILEQILPYFNPDYNLSLNAIPALDIKNDLPVLLNSIDYQDLYEGDFRNRQYIIWTLTFTLKMNYFGPINKQGMIRSVTTNTYSDQELFNKQQKYNVTVDPNTAVPNTDFTFIETFEEF